jgi:PAS domain S-box-containing protein
MLDLKALITPPASNAFIKVMNGRKRSGDVVPLNIKVAVWGDEELGTQYALSVCDITEEEAAYKSAAEEIQRTNAALTTLGIGVFEYNTQSKTYIVSDAYRELLGVRHLGLQDRLEAWRERVHPDDIAMTLEMYQKCIEGHVEQASGEYRLQSVDGSYWQWMHVSVSIATRDDAGRPDRLVGVIREVTDSKTADQSLRISLDQFRSVFENSPIGKTIVSLDGTFTIVNPALCELLGYSGQQLEKMRFQDVVHPEELEADLMQFYRMVTGEIPHIQDERRFVHADGSVIWVHISVNSVNAVDEKPDHFIAQFVDITEQRRLHDMKSDFVATVSHELRTPLTSILGAVDLLSATISADLPDQAQRLLSIAKDNGNRLKSLINDILDFEKFSAGKMQLSTSPHKVSNLVESAILANMNTTERYGIPFNFVNPESPVVACVDSERFRQVMTNLLTNAAKFSNEDCAVDISIDTLDEFVRVSVANTGQGISDTFRNQIFAPFSQADPSDTRARDGSGLGLHISKLIVEQTGGQIGYDSVPMGKTTFWFTVPIVEA